MSLYSRILRIVKPYMTGRVGPLNGRGPCDPQTGWESKEIPLSSLSGPRQVRFTEQIRVVPLSLWKCRGRFGGNRWRDWCDNYTFGFPGEGGILMLESRTDPRLHSGKLEVGS